MMKKFISLIVLLVAFTSCEEDVKFNNPAVQGMKDDELWRSTEFEAVIEDDELTITATNGFETVVLKTEATDAGEYILGEDDINIATYDFDIDGISDFFTTGTGVGNGIIEITEENTNLESANKKYISGNFRFNAVNDEGTVVNFKDGVFYKVPVTIVLP